MLCFQHMAFFILLISTVVLLRPLIFCFIAIQLFSVCFFLICCKPFYIRSCVLFRNYYASINVFKNFVFYVWTSTFCIYIVSWCAWLAMYVIFLCDFVMSVKKLFQRSGSVADEVGIVSVFFIFRWLSLILHSERIYIWASHFSLFLYFFARCFSVLYLWPVYYFLVCKSHTMAPRSQIR